MTQLSLSSAPELAMWVQAFTGQASPGDGISGRVPLWLMLLGIIAGVGIFLWLLGIIIRLLLKQRQRQSLPEEGNQETGEPSSPSFKDAVNNDEAVAKDSKVFKEEADRILKGALEYEKVVYDFYKHMLTIALAAIAAFGAILGGAYSDPSSWQGDEEPLLLLLEIDRSQLILIIFLALLMAALGGALQAKQAMDRIYLLGHVPTSEENIAQFSQEELLNHLRHHAGFHLLLSVYGPFGVALIGFLTFIMEST